MSMPLMQKVLGDDWQQLPELIQRHYRISDGQQSRLVGTMEIGYPGYLFPLIWVIHLFGGLLLWRGQAARAEVDKAADANGELYWYRTMTYEDGKTDCFSSRMHYGADHELIESIGFGFGLRLSVSVVNGDLLYRGIGHFWQWGRICLNIPDCLLLGAASITEHAVSEDEFYLDFNIRHPWWGRSYYYRGRFRNSR